MSTERFSSETWTAGVIGLGYVGLPLAVAIADAGLPVIGYDVDPAKVARLRDGVTVVEDVGHEGLGRALAAGLDITADEQALTDADALFIAVPSPLGRNRQPDLSYIERAAETVRRVARPGQLISLESTTYPGTTEEVLLPAATAGRRLDEDVWVCFSPERVDPGNALGTTAIPKLVGGITEVSGEVGAAAYRRFISAVHVVTSARAAELAKLLENSYRAVNIALANEMAQMAASFDVDIWEVIDAAATKPFGFQPFYPGPGVGGHCIPLDPQFLAWKARELRASTRFIDLADDVNRGMPRYVADRAAALLNDQGNAVRGSRILGLGVAYKRDVSDARESPAPEVLGELASRGAAIAVHDDHVADADLASLGLRRDDGAEAFDLGIVLTDHSDVDYVAVARRCEVVLDARGVYRRLPEIPANVVLL